MNTHYTINRTFEILNESLASACHRVHVKRCVAAIKRMVDMYLFIYFNCIFITLKSNTV